MIQTTATNKTIKTMRIPSLLLLIFALLLPLSSWATVTLSLQTGVMRQSDSSPVPLDSVGVLVADTLDNGFSNGGSLVGSSLSVGQALGQSDNLILDIFHAADIGSGVIGFHDTFTYTYSGNFAPGDPLALYWFPSITATGTVIGSGLSYGFYRNSANDLNSGSDIGFVAPGDGSLSNLFAFDNITDPGALASPSDFTASLTTMPVPEPSPLALLMFAGFGVLVMWRRVRPKSAF